LAGAFIFDQAATREFTAARERFLRRFLPEMKNALGLETALDVGCGVGQFTGVLRGMGIAARGWDGRAENVAEARRRVPDAAFEVVNIEDPAAAPGPFDLVLCFGLLYHLENPFRAARNLRALTGKLLLVESMCVPDSRPVFHLFDEGTTEDQSLGAVALYPSEAGLVKMLSRAGFPHVWKWAELPEHQHFRAGWKLRRRRTMLAASLHPLNFPFLLPASTQDDASAWDVWATRAERLTRPLRRVVRLAVGPARDSRSGGRRGLDESPRGSE
jgi:tRNA (mo5U34)-methyltransferase